MGEDYDYLFKCIVVGDGGVGKTALTLRFSKGFFTEDYKMTIGVDFHVKTISVDTEEGEIRSKLQIWDTGGQERFSSIRPMYYRGALGALLIFDLTSLGSFEHLPQWIEEVRANVQNEIPLLLVGNKSDLLDQRAISLEEINDFTRDFNLYYMETSAKTGDNVGDCFAILACLMIGEGVPDKLIAEGTVFAPGKIPIAPSEETYVPPEEVEPIQSQVTSTPESFTPSAAEYDSFEPEPESTSIPSPEPYNASESGEQDFTSQTQPEWQNESASTAEPVIFDADEAETEEEPFSFIEKEAEPEVPIPEPSAEQPSSTSDFEFKTPDQIMQESNERQQEAEQFSNLPTFSKSSPEGSYKPKAIPFSKSTPVPTKPPEEFQPEQPEIKQETSTGPVVFDSAETSQEKDTSSDSLYQYLPQTEEPKKQRKFFSRKKKTDKKEEPPQQIETEEPEPAATQTPSLFEALNRKPKPPEKKTPAFIPFTAPETERSPETQQEPEDKSNLRIIPNVDDLEDESDDFMTLTTSSSGIASDKELRMVVCPNCGATISSEYAFCNKCGSKLKY